MAASGSVAQFKYGVLIAPWGDPAADAKDVGHSLTGPTICSIPVGRGVEDFDRFVHKTAPGHLMSRSQQRSVPGRSEMVPRHVEEGHEPGTGEAPDRLSRVRAGGSDSAVVAPASSRAGSAAKLFEMRP